MIRSLQRIVAHWWVDPNMARIDESQDVHMPQGPYLVSVERDGRRCTAPLIVL